MQERGVTARAVLEHLRYLRVVRVGAHQLLRLAKELHDARDESARAGYLVLDEPAKAQAKRPKQLGDSRQPSEARRREMTGRSDN